MVAQPSKPKKSSKKDKTTGNPEGLELLQTEVASLASSLGFGSSVPYSGFDDSDFRKKGPIKKPSNKQSTDTTRDNVTAEGKKGNLAADDKRRPKPKPPVLSIDDSNAGNNAKGAAKFKNLPRLPLVKATTLGVWYEDAQQLEEKVIGEGKKLDIKNIDEWKALVEKKRELGERLMWQYAQDYEGSRGQSGDIKMLVATQRSGTAADKVSAFSVMVGDNPIANVRALDGLVGLVASKVGKRHALTGFEVLKELFVSSLIPDRKLKTLMQRPLNHLPENKDGYSLLLFWYWEECLKQRYERFIFSLEEASRDMLPVLKDKSLKTIYQLLKSKSEQERRLLSALVNKLGDPQNKGASNADFHLSNLLSEHPNMKAVVIDEVDSFLFRPHLGIRAKYHAVNFLSQIRLGHKGDGPKVAKRLIDVYFALFKVLITEAGASKKTKEWSSKKHGKKVPTAEEQTNESESHIELDSRILSALLTGVNRAFPFVSSSEADDIVEVQTPLLFKLVHSKNFNVGIQALMLLDKISSKNQIVSDRFYRALYSKLLLPAAMHSSKAEMFIGLLLRAMKNDVNLNRVAAFSKRLLQVALQLPPNYACGYLFLLSELLKARPPLWNMVQQSEAVDDEVEHFEDIKEEGDTEVETEPNKQSNGTNGDDNKEDGSSEDEDDEAPVSSSDNDDDDDDDVPNEDDELFIKDVSENGEDTNDSPKQPKQGSTRELLLPGGYDPRHREPLYSNAHRVCWWELTVLASHVHPSVATMARTLLSGANIVYNGNPLNDLTLTAFLEKLMEKKPKQATWHGGSQIEPAKKLEMNNHLIGSELLSLAETDVPPEDVVFHKFYLNKMKTTKKQKKKKKGIDDEDAEELFEVDGGDESDNEEISNIMDEPDLSDKEDGEYDYDDLDRVGVDDDDDLVGDASDVDMDGPSDDGEDIDFDVPDDVEGIDDDDDGVAIGDVDDGDDDDDDDDDDSLKKPKKRKSGASPFASLEEFEHLMKDDNDGDDGGPKLKKFKKDKKFKKEKTDKKKKKNKKSSK